MNRSHLPVPAFRQRNLDLCVVASYATAVYPFKKLDLDEVLIALKTYYSTLLTTVAPTDPGDYYQTHVGAMVRAQNYAQPGMLGWIEHLHGNTITHLFKAAANAATASIENDPCAVENALKENASIACISIEYDVIQNGAKRRCAHVVAAGCDAAGFYLRDSALDFPTSSIVDHEGKSLTAALEGSCVWKCDNRQVGHALLLKKRDCCL